MAALKIGSPDDLDSSGGFRDMASELLFMCVSLNFILSARLYRVLLSSAKCTCFSTITKWSDSATFSMFLKMMGEPWEASAQSKDGDTYGHLQNSMNADEPCENVPIFAVDGM